MQQVMPELLAHRHGQLFKRAVSVAELIKVLEYTMVGVVLQHAAFLKILEEISLYQCGLLGDIVNPKNPVKNLTSDQVRKIYTGEITNWKEVGGVDHVITPYIRNADSGSQEKMETLVMDGLKMIDGTEETYMYEIIGSQMASPYLQLEADEYGIGYTPFFYCTAMVRDLMMVDMISIDGVAPSKESLRSNKYPFVSSIYAAVRKTEDHESMAYKLYQFLFTQKGADMIDESGYIAIRK